MSLVLIAVCTSLDQNSFHSDCHFPGFGQNNSPSIVANTSVGTMKTMSSAPLPLMSFGFTQRLRNWFGLKPQRRPGSAKNVTLSSERLHRDEIAHPSVVMHTFGGRGNFGKPLAERSHVHPVADELQSDSNLKVLQQATSPEQVKKMTKVYDLYVFFFFFFCSKPTKGSLSRFQQRKRSEIDASCTIRSRVRHGSFSNTLGRRHSTP
jgi:hypothetical protein